MAEWFRLYWKYAVLFVAVCIAAAFIFKKAASAYKAHQKSFHEDEAMMRHLVELKNRYKDLTEEVIASAPNEELLEGVALSYQLVLQKKEDLSKEFALLSKEKQYVYALDVFVSDGSAKKFFKENGSELISIIAPAFSMIGLSQYGDTIKRLAIMFDENDETTSLDYKVIEAADEIFAKEDILTKIKLESARYIKNNPELFI